jgi:acyl carrier protein
MASAEEDELLDIIAAESVIRKENLVRSASMDELGLDSIVYVSVGYAVEEKYGVILEMDQLADVKTLGDFLDRVVPLIQAAKSKAHG